MHHAVPSAALWLAALLTGQLATALAILAVGGIGLAALLGAARPRPVLRVLAGLLILLAAPRLAGALFEFSGKDSVGAVEVPLAPAPPEAGARSICWTCY